MLSLFAGLTMSSALVWSTPQPVTDSFRQFYRVSNLAVNSLSMLYMVTYVLGLLPASYVLGNLGTRITILFGAAFTLLGASVRSFPLPRAQPSFLPVLLGQTLAGIGQCFTLGAPPAIAAIWFPPEERGKATALGTVANALGSVVSFAVGPSLAHRIPELLMLNTLICIVVAVPILLFFKERPPLPPSLAQSQDSFDMASFLTLLRDPQFLLLACGVGGALGSFWAVPTMLSQSIVPQGYTEGDAGILGMVLIGSGLLGSFAAGLLLDLLPSRHKLLIVACGLAGLAAMCGYTLSMVPGGLVPLYVSVTCLGFFLSALCPLGMEAAAECAFPLPEPVTSGCLMFTANLLALVLTGGMSALQDQDPGGTEASNWFATGALGVSVVCLMVWRFERKRTSMESTISSTSVKLGLDSISPQFDD